MQYYHLKLGTYKHSPEYWHPLIARWLLVWCNKCHRNVVHRRSCVSGIPLSHVDGHKKRNSQRWGHKKYRSISKRFSLSHSTQCLGKKRLEIQKTIETSKFMRRDRTNTDKSSTNNKYNGWYKHIAYIT